MDSHVLFKVTLVIKSAFTDVANERPLLHVNSRVSLQLHFIHEMLIAVVTDKRRGVKVHVLLQAEGI